MDLRKIDILYEDNHIIVANKPVGVLSQEDYSGAADMLNILKKYLREKYQKTGAAYLGLVQRLDRPVSGVMVFAKTSKAASRLSASIREKHFDKIYLALTDGFFPEPCGELCNYLGEAKNGIVTDVGAKLGKRSELIFTKIKDITLADHRQASLLLVALKTGRKHQIRAQFALRGYPLIGDYRYNPLASQSVYKNPGLHALLLAFRHPVKKEPVLFVASPVQNCCFQGFAIEDMSPRLSDFAAAHTNLSDICDTKAFFTQKNILSALQRPPVDVANYR